MIGDDKDTYMGSGKMSAPSIRCVACGSWHAAQPTQAQAVAENIAVNERGELSRMDKDKPFELTPFGERLEQLEAKVRNRADAVRGQDIAMVENLKLLRLENEILWKLVVRLTGTKLPESK